MTTVDVHAHTIVPDVFPLIAGQPGFRDEQEQQLRTFGRESVERNARLAASEYAPLLNDMSSRLTAMDAAGIDVQAVSVIPTQYHYWADRGLAGEICGAINEHIAAMARDQPGRVVGLATVALQHPDLAAVQLADAIGRLGLRGACAGPLRRRGAVARGRRRLRQPFAVGAAADGPDEDHREGGYEREGSRHGGQG